MTNRILRLMFAAVCALPQLAAAQNNGNNNDVGGIRIDAEGVVSLAIQQDRGGKLDKRRKAALAKFALPGEVSRPSAARCVSLVKLEAECEKLLAEGKQFTPDMQYMAGLTRIDEIYLNPGEKDLLLCGPAEPFVTSESGRVIGLESGRPVLRLDDLIVALRAVLGEGEIGCSIDPVPERLGNLQAFLKQNSNAATPEIIDQRYRRMREILGQHDVRLFGVPADSHFARGLLEADYRMKTLALGLEQPGVKGFKSHLSLVGSGNAMQRWWFVPLYEEITRSADGLAFGLVGQRAQVLGEDELANAQGQRSQAATSKLSTKAFSKQFTQKLPELAERMPVFAQLQQLIDWTILAALIRQERLADQIDWKMDLFTDADRLPHASFPVPTQTECLINTKVTGTGIVVGQLSGGVTIRPESVLLQMSVSEQTANTELAERRSKVLERPPAASHAWWWD